MSLFTRYRSNVAHALLASSLVFVSGLSQAAIPVSSTPLFLTVTVPPNVVVTLDDSGSMRRAYTPEPCGPSGADCAALDNRYWKSSNVNAMYYNPTVTYPVPKDATGTNLAPASFTNAERNGFDSAGPNINLSTSYKPYSGLDLNNNVTTEYFMGHYPGDVARCKPGATGSARVCQYKNTSNAWIDTAVSCNIGGGATARDNLCEGAQGSGADPLPVPAYYYTYNSAVAGCTPTNNNCYTLVQVTSTSGPGGTDERQNFANWFSFARTRNLTTATAATLAFADLPSTFRIAWQGINSCVGPNDTTFTTNSCDGWKNNFSFSNSIDFFTGQQRTDFYAWLFQQPTAGNTPLPAAMKRAGEYFSTTGSGSPYDNDLSGPGTSQLSCRRNFHIMMTDGMWGTYSNVATQDDTTKTLPVTKVLPAPEANITQYVPAAPYADASTYDNTLADVAFHYWVNDLTSGLANDVPINYKDRIGTNTQQFWNPKNDPAVWQHMVNFTIGLGLKSYLEDPTVGFTWGGNMYAGSYPQLLTGAKQWPRAYNDSDNPGNAADLWHAAINSRGQFFNADDPASLAASFKSAVSAITGSAGAAAALSTNSTRLQPNDTLVYQAKFDPAGWSGGLLAFQVNASGIVQASTPQWNASTLLPAENLRKIYSYNGSAGIVFDANLADATCATSTLSAAQRTALNKNAAGVVDSKCAERVKWLRGSSAKEQRNAGTLRDRPTTTMGDIINSDPAYVKAEDYEYASLPVATPGQSLYANFVATNGAPLPATSRTPMVYVGANDGKLYGIRADIGNAASGVEQFSYIPSGVTDNLSALTDPAYQHTFYVDGGITAGDAFLGGSWHSIITAGLNAGGKTIYALDVTDPDNFDQTKVMWEITAPEMGLTYSQPQIGILESGDWVAIVGNGYNSTGGNGGGGAYLYVINLSTGAIMKTLAASDAAGDESNGLSTPVLYDSDGNHKIDVVYAGDLLGNMWRFDLSNASSAAWPSAGTLLFASGKPITAQPAVGPHTTSGNMVYFGTGRYLTSSDVNDLSVQTFYGIRDNAGATVLASSLQQQTIIGQTATARVTSQYTVNYATQNGFYLDLVEPPSTARGERVVSRPLIPKSAPDRVLFVSVIPTSNDPCKPGGVSWLMELDVVNGGRFNSPILDTNGDGFVDATDTIKIGGVDYPASGTQDTALGISKTPVWLDGTGAQAGYAYKILTGTGDIFQTVVNKSPGSAPPPGPSGTVTRRSWIQIR